MTAIDSLDQLAERIASHPMVLVYLSRPDCSVCTALKPAVSAMIDDVPEAESWYVDLDRFPEAAGTYSIFAVPGILLFVDGRESIREARFVHTEELGGRIARLRELRFTEAP